MKVESWKAYKICEVSEVITGYPFEGEKYDYSFGTRVLRGENITEGRLRWDTIKYWNQRFDRYDDYSLRTGDIVIGMDGSKVGKNKSQIKTIDLPLLLAQRVACLRSHDGFDQNFLLYIINNTRFENYVSLMKTGTTIPHISSQQIKDYSFTAPISKLEQSKIASILSSLDEKIELNLQMNKTLESIALAIFKEWFVDFRFPGFDGELVDGLPKGWRKVKLNSLIEIKHGYAFKGKYFSDVQSENVLLTPGNFKIGGGFNYSKLRYYLGDSPTEYILKKDDLIVTMTDLSKEGDTLGYSALIPEYNGFNFLHNQRIGKVIFKTNESLKYYLYWLMRQQNYRHFIIGGATGSTVKHTSPSRICDFEIILPTSEILMNFTNIAMDLSDKEQYNECQNRCLQGIRDNLLPKLMSGRIRVA